MLVRNGVLATVAAFVLWAGYDGGAGPSAQAWLEVLSTAQLVGLLAYAVGERARLPMHPHQPQTEGQPCPECGKVHAAAPTMPAARELGEPAPGVKLADLQGTTVELEDFKGQETLVLFWNPGCGFCQQILPRSCSSRRAPRRQTLLHSL